MTADRIRPLIQETLSGAWYGKAVYTAAKLGIADLLLDGPQSVEELAGKTGANPGALHRVLRALASIGIFRYDEHRRVELTELAAPLAENHPDSVRWFALMANEQLFEAFIDFDHTIHTAEPAFDQRFGMSVFEYFESHPDAGITFHRAMQGWSRWDTGDILNAFDFSAFSKVVDVGGGNGAFLSALLARYPKLTGVLLDLESGISAARAGQGGPLPRCELVVGNFLEEVPSEGDLYVIKHVMDGWPDDAVVRMLSNCREASAPGGRVIALESVIEPGNTPSYIKWVDVMIMAVTPGRFREVPEVTRLFERANLRIEQVIRVSETISLFVGVGVDDIL